MARRLVEAGARCVTLGFGRWDYHGEQLRPVPRAICRSSTWRLSALVDDLHARGLDKDVSVVVWGEFGRTPKINKEGGRDHWPPRLLRPAGRRRDADRPGDRLDRTASARSPRIGPCTFQNVFATLYHNLGIDADAPRCPTAPAGRCTCSTVRAHPRIDLKRPRRRRNSRLPRRRGFALRSSNNTPNHQATGAMLTYS